MGGRRTSASVLRTAYLVLCTFRFPALAVRHPPLAQTPPAAWRRGPRGASPAAKRCCHPSPPAACCPLPAALRVLYFSMSPDAPPPSPALSLLANLLLAGVITTVAVLNVRPVYTGRLVEEARWQHGWPLPCLHRHRAMERLERRFGWLSPNWPRPGAPSGAYFGHRGAFIVDAAVALVLVVSTAVVTSRLLRGRGNPRRLGPATLFWLAGIAAAVWFLVRVDRPGVELAMTGLVCLGAASALHLVFLLLTGFGRQR